MPALASRGWWTGVVAIVAAFAGAAAVAPSTAAAVSGPQVVRYAETFAGAPYAWGAGGPAAFDCSGLVAAAYAHFGVALPRASYDQMDEGTAVRGALRRGDLVFWNGGEHVGIYVGGRRFLSATVHAGVAVYPMRVWARTQAYSGARRIVGALAGGTATEPGRSTATSDSGGTLAPG